MSVIKKLAGETALYGLSSILARLVNFILVPLHTAVFKERGDYGVVGQMYGWIALGVVLYTMRLETAYFRYASQDPQSSSYSTAKSSIVGIALIGSSLIFLFAGPIAGFLEIENYGYLIRLAAGIIALDALCELPFARLRLEKRPRRFVAIKSINILINVALNFFFLWWLPGKGFGFFDEKKLVSYVFLANLIASVITLLLLSKEFTAGGFALDRKEIKKIFSYSLPLLIVGLAGVIDDAMTRQFLGWLAPGTLAEKQIQMGEYNACVKFAVFISLFVQAFRYAAEPFFFKHMHQENARHDYSRITTWFTRFLMLGFVVVLLYLDFYKNIIVRTPEYLRALGIVPIVLMANVFLGIYYNVSNWYRLTDRTQYGMYSALVGVGLTIGFNLLLVPRFGYMGTAWSMLICYFGMTLITYVWGQKYYPVPYELGKMAAAIFSGIAIYLLSLFLKNQFNWSALTQFLVNSLLAGVFVFVIFGKLISEQVKKARFF